MMKLEMIDYLLSDLKCQTMMKYIVMVIHVPLQKVLKNIFSLFHSNLIFIDTHDIANETKHLMIEARSNLTVLICCILLISLVSIFLSTWLAKTITDTPTSFGSIVSHYFGFDRNSSEQYLTWWTPVHVRSNELISANNRSNPTPKAMPFAIPYLDYPNFHTIVLPLLFICSILLAILAYVARIKCTNRGFAWGAVPKIPLGRVDPKVAIDKIVKVKEAEPGIDYTIVQGTQNESVVFALAETLEPLREEGDIIDEGTQYEPEDVLK
jgi:hypothetical protein